MRRTGRLRRTLTIAAALSLATAAACSSSGGDVGAGPSRAEGGGGGSSSGDVSTSTTAPATTTTKPLRTFTLVGVGDILSHGTLIQQARARAGGNGYELDSLFAEVKPLIERADFAICHQETPISADNTNLTQPMTISFNAPTELAASLKEAGFDACSTSSNHSLDRGVDGIRQTLDVMDAAGLGHAGTTRNAEEAAQPGGLYDVAGVKLGHLAYSYTITNDNSSPNTFVPSTAPWLREMLWPLIGAEGILAHAKQLKAKGAEFVVVSMHWGDQYVVQPTAQQRQLAQQLLASPDVDMILGDHVHVVQPCEKIGNEYVLYGMGNFVSNQSPSQDRSLKVDVEDGTLNTLTVQETSPGVFATTRLEVTPTHVKLPGHVVQVASPTTNKASFDRTAQKVLSLGAACDPIVTQ